MADKTETQTAAAPAKLVTIVYSRHRAAYRVPELNQPFWLSVATYPGTAADYAPSAPWFLGAAGPDGAVRKMYATGWAALVEASRHTVAETDTLVKAYAVAEVLTEQEN